MEELQTVYTDETAAEMYRLRVPTVGRYLSLLNNQVYYSHRKAILK